MRKYAVIYSQHNQSLPPGRTHNYETHENGKTIAGETKSELSISLFPIHDLRITIPDSRFTIYDSRFTIHEYDNCKMNINAYIGITDTNWFELLKSKPGIDEVNFWKPGELFLFKLHAPENYIVGGGFYYTWL